MKPRDLALAGLSLLPVVGCDSGIPPATPGVGSSPPAASAAPAAPGSEAPPPPRAGAAPAANPLPASRSQAKAFLDQTKEVDPGQAWSREVGSQRGGAIAFRVESQGTFSVSVLTETGYRAVQGGSGPRLEDLLLTADPKGTTHEGKVTLPAGQSWFIIENRSGRKAQIRLVCSPAQ
jgi:hypothetical protein